MNGCIESGQQLLPQLLDETIEVLVPVIQALLQRLEPETAVASEADDMGHRVVVPIAFPDGIGRGAIVARLFRYRDRIRVDIEVSHNRMIARPDGRPSDRRSFLNDFVASITLDPGARELPPEFVRHVGRGVAAARDGIQRHNRAQSAPWNQMRVVAIEEVGPPTSR